MIGLKSGVRFAFWRYWVPPGASNARTGRHQINRCSKPCLPKLTREIRLLDNLQGLTEDFGSASYISVIFHTRIILESIANQSRPSRLAVRRESRCDSAQSSPSNAVLSTCAIGRAARTKHGV